MHGCYAGRVYDMAVVVPGLPEGPGYARDAALAALVRPLPSLSTGAVGKLLRAERCLGCFSASAHSSTTASIMRCESPTPCNMEPLTSR